MAMDKLPLGWTPTTLGEICTKPQYGWTTKAKKNGVLKYIRTTDISTGKINWPSVPYCDKAPNEINKYKVWKDDILIARAGSVGVSYRIQTTDTDAVFASYLIRFRPHNEVIPAYIELYLNTNDFWNAISENSAGIAIPNVNASKLSKLEIPLPPYEEQRRIVAKLEKLLAKVDACKERLKKIPAILKRFRQSVLASACSGRLTADWRENNPDVKLPPGFIKRVLHPIELNPNDNTQCKLPNTWALVKIEEICGHIVDCPHSTPKWTNEGVICLRTSNFQPGSLDLTELRYVSKQVYAQRTARLEPKPGDVLYSREGGILGVACLVPEKPRVCLGQRMMIMRPFDSICLSTFLMNVLNSELVLSRVRDLTGGTASPHLNVGEIKSFLISLPPIEEQHEIVRRVEALFKIADDIEKRYQKAKAHVDKLTQSILAKAFRGELVPQDPADEPASELLKRIQEERRKQAAERSPGRKGIRRREKAKSSTL